ncbi:hypothetical protein CPB83DRAFT_563205 [Crepidotus variabilis]|uniref:Steroid 5-alpha reductase C-terminal domain-containing protein n=1 Tax=Crepidotus variabilis TaxID=179855 RepID=A0A9P6E9Z4_9AGAR|nr:hypothetical protein CPB83DRAFT_563205 [Crepidotus variabilis]
MSNIHQRGNKNSSPLGSTVLFTLRALDPILQYGIFAHGIGVPLLAKLGLKAITDGPPIQTGIGFIDALQLSPYRLLLLTMVTGSTIKHNFWLLYTSEEAMSLSFALFVSVFNTVMNSSISLLATTAFGNGGELSRPSVIIGSTLYFVGVFTEMIAEVQRKKFKEDPRNKGKLYTERLWSITRHINFTAYTAWRGGFALVGGGWLVGTGVSAFFLAGFIGASIPELAGYCSKKYGGQWDNYKKKTPYQIIPGVY